MRAQVVVSGAADQPAKWRPVIGYEGRYSVSCNGEVWSHSKGVLRALNVDSEGYMRVTLQVDRIKKSHRVHRLVAEAFIPNPDGKPQVNHKNLDTVDNRVGNLEWATPLENTGHFFRSSKAKQRAAKRRLLTDEQVLQVRRLYREEGLSTRQISSVVGLAKSAVHRVVAGETYAEV